LYSELKRIREEMAIAYFKAVSWNQLGGTEESHGSY
jgi:hypothetical protein